MLYFALSFFLAVHSTAFAGSKDKNPCGTAFEDSAVPGGSGYRDNAYDPRLQHFDPAVASTFEKIPFGKMISLEIRKPLFSFQRYRYGRFEGFTPDGKLVLVEAKKGRRVLIKTKDLLLDRVRRGLVVPELFGVPLRQLIALETKREDGSTSVELGRIASFGDEGTVYFNKVTSGEVIELSPREYRFRNLGSVSLQPAPKEALSESSRFDIQKNHEEFVTGNQIREFEFFNASDGQQHYYFEGLKINHRYAFRGASGGWYQGRLLGFLRSQSSPGVVVQLDESSSVVALITGGVGRFSIRTVQYDIKRSISGFDILVLETGVYSYRGSPAQVLGIGNDGKVLAFSKALPVDLEDLSVEWR